MFVSGPANRFIKKSRDGESSVNRTIFVRRSVLSAAQRLEALVDSGSNINPIDLAENKINDCQAAGDSAGVKFWRCVWTHLMIARETPVCFQIIEETDLRAQDGDISSRVVAENIGAKVI
jgi:hypothetical protein